MRSRVVILGASLGGVAAAATIKRQLGDDVDVTLVARADRLLFNPSLAAGLRRHDIAFLQGAAVALDPVQRSVHLADRHCFYYEYLVIATGRCDRDDVLGHEFLTHVDGLTDESGCVNVRPTCQSERYDEIYAVGAAASLDTPPKAGLTAVEMASVAARSITSQVRGRGDRPNQIGHLVPALSGPVPVPDDALRG